ELSERDFEFVKAGDKALIRLIGADEWVAGPVIQVRGSAASYDQRLLAAHIFEPTGKSIYVEVALPHTSITPDGSKFCDIGRLAEVRFHRSSLPFLASLQNQLNRVASWFGGEKPIRTAWK
ncbi:MAG: hypothetical protein V3R85_11810, partial [Alphaproteobacteria bacterium]